MKVKISTKEKFHTLEVKEENLSANMTENLTWEVKNFLDGKVKNVVLNLKEVKKIAEEIPPALVYVTDLFKNHNASFVICELQPEVKKNLTKLDAENILNITPTESEAWDIIQMDEIERELMQDENE